jgi:hypothetical protein
VVTKVAGYSYADVVERLFAEFGDRMTLPVIVDAVHECHEQLSSVPASALPEMLERLARQRLTSTARRAPTLPPEEIPGFADDRNRADAEHPATVAAEVTAGQ